MKIYRFLICAKKCDVVSVNKNFTNFKAELKKYCKIFEVKVFAVLYTLTDEPFYAKTVLPRGWFNKLQDTVYGLPPRTVMARLF